MLIIGGGNLRGQLERLFKDAIASIEKELSEIKSVRDLAAKVKQLRSQVEELEVAKGRKEEEFARKEREIEHKVGLERKRQEMELTLGRKEASLDARTAALDADRQRFEDQMKFHQDRFEAEVTYQRELLEKMLKRLPTAEIIAQIGGGKDKEEQDGTR